jgi:anhydro-N-acetylmuramic acid kinase
MSGTSADGVDGVLVRWAGGQALHVLGHCHRPFEPSLREQLLALNVTGADELHRSALAAVRLSSVYAEVVGALLQSAGLNASAVRAIGAHGQTVRHQPKRAPEPPRTTPWPEPGYTLQLLNAAWLAELTGIDVVCDFRSADVASGGQGAPLVPAAHNAWFARDDAAVAVVNIGGMANLSLLPARAAGPDQAVRGFDTGPGNVLMDVWMQRHWQRPYDADGAGAAEGQVHQTLLNTLLADPYFGLQPPKSTGRDLFDEGWLLRHLQPSTPPSPAARPIDVLATLAELTACSIARDLLTHAPSSAELLVCGGGARNGHLMRRLQAHLPGIPVVSTATRGYPVDQVEALAFAWLAKAFVEGTHGNLPSVTGARRGRILGALYRAG